MTALLREFGLHVRNIGQKVRDVAVKVPEFELLVRDFGRKYVSLAARSPTFNRDHGAIAQSHEAKHSRK